MVNKGVILVPLENIIKYATNTPTNTNPAVMSSVINSSFKQTKEEILNEAKAYSDSKGGYTMPAKKYTFDGNVEGKPVMNMGDFVMVQISGDVVDVFAVQTITVNNFIASADEFQIVNTDGGVAIGLDNGPYVILLKTGGVLVRYEEGGDCVREVACKETIVPIKSEYLPDMGGGGLTVIKMEEPVTENRDMTESEAAKFEAAAEIGHPVIVQFNNNGIQFSLLCHLAKTTGLVMFNAIFTDGASNASYIFGKQGDAWVVAVNG